jgi:hypothetical protein
MANFVYIYMKLHIHSSIQRKKNAYETIMRSTKVLIFVVLSLLQVALAKRKLLKFNPKKDLKE